MKAKTMNKLNAENTLVTKILEAINEAGKAGLSEDDVKSVLNRIVEVIESEE